MNYLSICSVVRDEAPYLPEWVEFHRLQGVDHFYIFDNESKDDTEKVLQRYVDRKIVTYHKYIGHAIQLKAFQFYLDQYQKESEWTAFIDADEFLWGSSGIDIKDFLANTTPADAAVVAVYWILFGSRVTTLEGLVTERFNWRQRGVDKHVKSIVRRNQGVRVGKNPHAFHTSKKIVDCGGKVLTGEYGVTEGGVETPLVINHYHTKTFQEYYKRKSTKPDANSGRRYDDTRINEMFMAHNHNEVPDFRMRKFTEQIKREMANA